MAQPKNVRFVLESKVDSLVAAELRNPISTTRLELLPLVSAEAATAATGALANNGTVAAAAATAAEAAVVAEMVGKDLLEGSNIAEADLAFAVTDEDGRRTWIEVDLEGKPTTRASSLISEKVAPGITTTVEASVGVQTQNTEVTGIAFGVVDEDGRRTELEVSADGKLTQRVIDSISARLGIIGIVTPTMFKSTYSDTVQRLVSGPDITCWGDSMTAGAGGNGTTYPSTIASLTGRTVHNRGVGGETSVTITARSGSTPLIAIPQAGVIPADTAAFRILLQPINGQPTLPLKQGNASFTTGSMMLNDGTLVPGTISRTTDVDAVTDLYWFARSTAGTQLTANRPMTWLSTDAEARRGDITCIWIGQNGPGNERAIQDAWAIINHLNAAEKRWLVISRPTSTDAEDARWHEEFGRRHIAIRKYMVQYGLADAGLTPTTQDNTDMANGVVPTQLRIDSVHWTAAGYTILGQQVRNRLKEMGWI